jgi:hypothetical protein
MNRELKVNITGDNTKFKQATQDTVKSIGTLKDEYRRLSRTSLVGATPEEVEALNKRLAQLKDQINDTNKTIKSMSLDNFERMAETTQVASTMMAGFAGAATLAGGSQEELNKLMQKTVALMAIAKSAQEAQYFFQERAVGIMIKNKYKEISANLQNIFTIKTQAAATAQLSTVQGGATATTGILTKATMIWNKVIAANPIFFILAVIIAVIGGLYALSKALGDNTKEAKGYEKTLDGVVVQNEEIRKQHNEAIKQMRRLQNEWDLLTGSITAHEKALRDTRMTYEEEMKAINDEYEKDLDNLSRWNSKRTKQLIDASQKRNAAAKSIQDKHNHEMSVLFYKTAEDELTAMKEAAVITAQTKKEELNAQIELLKHHFEKETKELDKRSHAYKLKETRLHSSIKELTSSYNNELLKIKQERLKKELEMQKQHQDFMFAESFAYWKREILIAEQEGKTLMDAKLSLLEAETEQKLSKVAKGSEQELLILKEAEIEKGKIMREGFKYQIDLYDTLNSEIGQRLEITKQLHKVYGDTYDILGDQIRIYETEIQRLIENGYDAEDASITKLIEKLKELERVRNQQLEDAERVKKSQEELERASLDMAQSFGQAMGSMVRDGKEGASELIKQALATAIAFVINQVIQEVEWPYNLVVAAGASAVTYALFDQVPALAQGGIATSPTLAMVGDNPNARIDPEVIAPLSKLKGILSESISGGADDMSKVVFEIRGDTLVGILEKYNKYQDRYK